MQSNKKVILITGTSSGIGNYLALKLLKKYLVIGISRRKKKILKKNYFHYKLDINNFDLMEIVMKKIIKKFKKIDILINNAGTNISHGSIYFTNKDSIEKTIYTNLISTVLITKEVLRYMVPKKKGKVINIGSSVLNLLPEGESVYTASKAGLVYFSKVLSKEMKKFFISVNCVSPFILDTEMIKKINKEKIKEILKTTKKKKNSLNDVYKVILKIINDSKITGKNIYL